MGKLSPKVKEFAQVNMACKLVELGFELWQSGSRVCVFNHCAKKKQIHLLRTSRQVGTSSRSFYPAFCQLRWNRTESQLLLAVVATKSLATKQPPVDPRTMAWWHFLNSVNRQHQNSHLGNLEGLQIAKFSITYIHKYIYPLYIIYILTYMHYGTQLSLCLKAESSSTNQKLHDLAGGASSLLWNNSMKYDP